MPTTVAEIEDLFYLEAQQSAESPSVSGRLFHHEPEIMMRDGATSARKRGKSHLQISATYLYSSWERAQAELLEQEAEKSMADSLSRIFELESQPQYELDAEAEDSSILQQVISIVKIVKEEAQNLKDVALRSCSTSACSSKIQQVSESMENNLSYMEELLKDSEQNQKRGIKEKIKFLLRHEGIGADAKRYHSIAHIEQDCQILACKLNALSDRNARVMGRQKKRLLGYERELYQMLNAVQKFQGRKSGHRPVQPTSKLGKTSIFTGYNGMRLGEEAHAAPGMALGGLRNQCSNSMISAYGSQGVMLRDTSQLLNMTPLQGGKTSTLTNSNIKTNPQVMNSRSSSGERIILRDDHANGKFQNNILIAEQSDTTSIMGQLRNTNLASSNGNIMDNAMIASMTQRSHNLGGITQMNAYENEDESHVASCRKPQTARCGSTTTGANFPDRSFILGLNLAQNRQNDQRELRELLESLHDGLRSLAERIHETATAQIRTWQDKSDRAISSMRSHFQHMHKDRKGKAGLKLTGSDSRLRSVRGSSKSQRQMRFKRYRSHNTRTRDHSSVEHHRQRGRAICRQRSQLMGEQGNNTQLMGRLVSENCSPMESAQINPFNRAFIKSSYHDGGAPVFFTQYDSASQQYSGENSQSFFTGTNTYFQFGGPRGDATNMQFPLCKTLAEQAQLPAFLPRNQNASAKFTDDRTQSGFYSARNDFNVHQLLHRPSETVPVTNKVSRLVSNNASQVESLISNDSNNSQSNIKQQDLRLMTPGQQQLGIPMGFDQQVPSTNNIQQLLNLSKLSERRQEFSATFNNQLSSVKKDNSESSGDSKYAGAIIPNFYPKQQMPETSSFNLNVDFEQHNDNSKVNEVIAEPIVRAKAKKGTKAATKRKNKYDSENGPKIPKLNLGKIKTAVKNDYFMKNISDYDDTSLGDYEMILRNQRGGVVKDPSILTASKSQNNQYMSSQSMGSYNNSRFQSKSRVKGRDQHLRFTSKHQTVVSKKSHYRQGGVKNNMMSFSKKRGKKVAGKVQTHASALVDSSLQHQMRFNQSHHQLARLPSEGHSSTKQVLNNMTGCTSSYAINQQQIGVDMRSSKLVAGYNDEPVAGDPYMSFIDSDKFSPIQSVSGEENDDDDSLDQQKAKILFFDDSAQKPQAEERYEQPETETPEVPVEIKQVVTASDWVEAQPQTEKIVMQQDLLASSFERVLKDFDVQENERALTPQQIQEALQKLEESTEVPKNQKSPRSARKRRNLNREHTDTNAIVQDKSQKKIRRSGLLDEGSNKQQVHQQTPKSRKALPHGKKRSPSKLPPKNKYQIMQQRSQEDIRQLAQQQVLGLPKRTENQLQMMVQQKFMRGDKQQVSNRNRQNNVNNVIPGLKPSPNGTKNDSNNFTLGATNINVFTLSPRAFSNSMLSSLSKELLSNLSSGQKKQPFVFSFQSSNTKFEQVPQKFLIDPQGQALQKLINNPIVKKNSNRMNNVLRNSDVYQNQKQKSATVRQGRTPPKPRDEVMVMPNAQQNMSKRGAREVAAAAPILEVKQIVPIQKTQVIDQELPLSMSKRNFQENILVLPLHIQKRRELLKNEHDQSKKSLCLLETFPETLITLNREILAKRLSSSNENKICVSQHMLKSARESYRSLMPTEDAIRPIITEPSIAVVNYNKPELKLANETDSKAKSLGRMIPPKVPHTTRNVVKASNFDIKGANSTNDGKQMKFNFKPNLWQLKASTSSRQQSEKKDVKVKTPRKQSANDKTDSSSKQMEKDIITKKKLLNIRQLDQLRTLAFGGNSKRKDTNTAYKQQTMSKDKTKFLFSPTAISQQSQIKTPSNERCMICSNCQIIKITQCSHRENTIVNSSAQTQLMPNSTTNQSTGKLVFRKSALPIQIESETKKAEYSRRAGNQDYWGNSSNNSATHGIQQSNLILQAQGPQTEATQSSIQMSNLFDLLSPANANDTVSKTRKEKVVKQLITKLAKSQQSLKQQAHQQRNLNTKRVPKKTHATEMGISTTTTASNAAALSRPYCISEQQQRSTQQVHVRPSQQQQRLMDRNRDDQKMSSETLENSHLIEASLGTLSKKKTLNMRSRGP